MEFGGEEGCEDSEGASSEDCDDADDVMREVVVVIVGESIGGVVVVVLGGQIGSVLAGHGVVDFDMGLKGVRFVRREGMDRVRSSGYKVKKREKGRGGGGESPQRYWMDNHEGTRFYIPEGPLSK
jgi:hypothetical protein